MENVQSSSDADVTPRNEPKSKGGLAPSFHISAPCYPIMAADSSQTRKNMRAIRTFSKPTSPAGSQKVVNIKLGDTNTLLRVAFPPEKSDRSGKEKRTLVAKEWAYDDKFALMVQDLRSKVLVRSSYSDSHLESLEVVEGRPVEVAPRYHWKWLRVDLESRCWWLKWVGLTLDRSKLADENKADEELKRVEEIHRQIETLGFPGPQSCTLCGEIWKIDHTQTTIDLRSGLPLTSRTNSVCVGKASLSPFNAPTTNPTKSLSRTGKKAGQKKNTSIVDKQGNASLKCYVQLGRAFISMGTAGVEDHIKGVATRPRPGLLFNDSKLEFEPY